MQGYRGCISSRCVFHGCEKGSRSGFAFQLSVSLRLDSLLGGGVDLGDVDV